MPPKTLIAPLDLSMLQILNLIDDDENKPLSRTTNYPRRFASAFFEPSTRTKLSFHTAAKDAGYSVFDLPDSNSLAKGESLRDTIRNMVAICNPDVFVIRSKSETLIHEMSSEYPEISWVNAGNGTMHHPTQALGDLYTLKSFYGGWESLSTKTLTLVGDVRMSRVARSVRDLMQKMGITVRVGAPMKMIPEGGGWEGVEIVSSLQEALETDVVMSLRVQHERRPRRGVGYNKGFLDRQMEEWRITEEHLTSRPDLQVMHPGPVNRGVELTDGVVDGTQSLILRQAVAGYLMRRALLRQI